LAQSLTIPGLNLFFSCGDLERPSFPELRTDPALSVSVSLLRITGAGQREK